MKKKKEEDEEQKAQNWVEIVDETKKLFMHIGVYCQHDMKSNFYHISDNQWKTINEKIRFYYGCEENQVSFVDNARPFNCDYEEIMTQKPCRYTGFLVNNKKECYGMLTYWNGVVKYRGLFENDEAQSPKDFKKWN